MGGEVVYDLKKSFYWSSSFHAFALLFFLLSPYLPFHPYRPHEEKITWINLPKGVGGDLGAIQKALDLPKTTIEEQKKSAVEKQPPKPAMTYEKIRKSSKEKTEEEQTIEKVLAKARQQVAARKAAVPEAAQIPDGKAGGIPEGSAAGSKVLPDDPERLLYQLKIRQRVHQEWIPPLKFQGSLGLLCKLIVRINERGEVLETVWEQKSGNEAFDLSAVRAVQKSSPLDPPPDRLKWEALNEGFLFEFKPEEAP